MSMAGSTSAAQSAAAQAAQAVAVNAQIRAAILGNSIVVKQSIYDATILAPGATNNVLQIPFRNVGLVMGFLVKVTFNYTNAGAAAAVPTELNIANMLSNIVLTDLDNYQRINTAGWHLQFTGTRKEGFPQGAAMELAAIDTPIQYGSNFGVLSATASIGATTGTGSSQNYYWVPCAYSATDLRGSIFAGVVNATAYLQLTINPNPWIINAAGGGDPTLAIYTGATGGAPIISSATVQVYQVYLDQIPRYTSGPSAGSPILPPLDIATQYRLNNTSLTGVSPGQDFPIPFSNFQQFLSLNFIYDQNGTLAGGTDLNSIALAAANTYLPFKIDPTTAAWFSRHRIKTDYPNGVYMMDFSSAPVSTNQTGNMQILLNAITAAAGTKVLCGFESFALVNNVLGAASLPAS